MKNLKLISILSGAALLIVLLSFREAKTAHIKYEYLIIQSAYTSKINISVISNGTVLKEMPVTMLTLNTEISKLLNEYGNQGWELTSSDRGKAEEKNFYLRRSVE